MLVFIDESGYPGFKLTRGSDPVFAIGMVIFADGAAATATIHALDELRAQLGYALTASGAGIFSEI